MTGDADVIDALVGITPRSSLDAIRARRPEARAHAQATYRALFAPHAVGNIGLHERFAIAAFTAGLHEATAIATIYVERLVETGASAELKEAIDAAVTEARTRGPYGRYPIGPLSREDSPGPVYRVGPVIRRALGRRLAAAFEHVHMLVFHPRDAAPAALQALLDAGWSTTSIVTLSQIVAFLSFQIRVIAGLRVLAAHPAPREAAR
jgi:CMD domain protein